MSVTDGLGALKTLYDISMKVKDNQDELITVSRRLEHIILALEESRNKDVIRPDDYNDAWSVITALIERAQRIARRLLKRSLGDRTWNAAEITADLRRLNEDVQSYMGVHTLKVIDIMHTSQIEHNQTISADMKEVMARLAEIDLHLKSPETDSIWSPAVLQAAKAHKRSMVMSCEMDDYAELMSTPESAEYARQTVANLTDKFSVDVTIVASGRASHPSDPYTARADVILSGLKHWHTIDDIWSATIVQGQERMSNLRTLRYAEITIVDGISVYDASVTGGLQISRSEPISWWWSKYLEYHGMASATSPGHSVATLNDTRDTVSISGADITFHRTLRVPDREDASQLPPNLGTFKLLPVSNYAKSLPANIAEKGGFMTAMFPNEALWVSFNKFLSQGHGGPAVKVSVGGVNALSGCPIDAITPLSDEQDYLVAGLQPWIDGIATEPGVVRQFVVSTVGQGYTVEEQVAHRTDVRGMQFDIFPRRKATPVAFEKVEGKYTDVYALLSGRQCLDAAKTPVELGLLSGEQIAFPSQISLGEHWTINDYLHKISQNIVLHAMSREDDAFTIMNLKGGCAYSDARLGIAAGGKIKQRIYQDPQSPRAYDEEHGHRFHLHILTPEQWENVTGMLPPITPITKDTYRKHGIPWYTLQDHSIPSLSTTSAALSAVKSVTQLELEAKHGILESEVINPDCPPKCVRHPQSFTSTVFRPCGHTACDACLGKTLTQRSKCCFCSQPVVRVVGMKAPVAVMTETADGERDSGETAWDVHDIEELAASAADNNRVEVIYFAGQDRVAPLHASGGRV